MLKHFDHNRHHHRFLLRQVPPGAATALDVGCGDGAFARELAARGLRVTAVDRATEVTAAGVDFRRADAMVDDLGGPYDYVSAIASIHHMPLGPALARLRDVLAPGGVLAVLGVARERSAADWAFSLASVPLNLVARLVRDDPRGDAPVLRPALTLREIGAEADRVVPGARLRRHLFWRYSLIWRKAPPPAVTAG
ncbi:class I SAM-dependent methyltransferase [Saccharothrix coeruleofusca]|uniref:Methyltransferase n=1 Tax=Saccharothrix coeruleofusca TaxID=33919 RepID=A0A918ANM2_9PSEU|nr:class I SAM-dependent methyltransferase [Saccharothrix coeruleofusca]GGP63470.1 methyltransferase [Saccharothrix coeruleofusca]